MIGNTPLVFNESKLWCKKVQPEEKAEKVKQILLSYGRVGVAFSGGVDSSLLLKISLDVLGAGNVLIVHGVSCLQPVDDRKRAADWFQNNNLESGVLRVNVDLGPLTWKEFVKNNSDRCYFCKNRMYILFLEELKKFGFKILVDGTNVDDLRDNRPGLRAINELDVKIPLVDAGFNKNDIRYLSRMLGITSWNLPSSSCLATRIPHGLEITADRLQRISNWETSLHRLGFSGCRVHMDKINKETVYVEIQVGDMERFIRQPNRLSVTHFFQSNGINHVYLNIAGRSE